MQFVRLTEAQNPGELALIKSLLDGNDIEHYVHNEHLGGLYNLPVLPCVVMVHESELPRAEALISLLRAKPEKEPTGKRGKVVSLLKEK